ncbi:MAG: hypothetical protein Q9M13_05725 [Mariprofundales bacterium]|nr:hypothetical protein [Mariprofundales bacterium]
MDRLLYAAHITEDRAIHNLEEHLCMVGHRADAYALSFKSGDWAKLAGRWL